MFLPMFGAINITKLQNIPFKMIENTETQQIITFEKLDPENIFLVETPVMINWFIDYENRWQLVFCQSMNRLINCFNWCEKEEKKGQLPKQCSYFSPK